MTSSKNFVEYQDLEHSQVAGMGYDEESGKQIYYVPDSDDAESSPANDKFKKFRNYSNSKKSKPLTYEEDETDNSDPDCSVVVVPGTEPHKRFTKHTRVQMVPLSQISETSGSQPKPIPTGSPVLSSPKRAKTAKAAKVSEAPIPDSPASPTPSEQESLPDVAVPAPAYTTRKTVITEDETTHTVHEVGGEMRATLKRCHDQQVLESGRFNFHISPFFV